MAMLIETLKMGCLASYRAPFWKSLSSHSNSPLTLMDALRWRWLPDVISYDSYLEHALDTTEIRFRYIELRV